MPTVPTCYQIWPFLTLIYRRGLVCREKTKPTEEDNICQLNACDIGFLDWPLTNKLFLGTKYHLFQSIQLESQPICGLTLLLIWKDQKRSANHIYRRKEANFTKKKPISDFGKLKTEHEILDRSFSVQVWSSVQAVAKQLRKDKNRGLKKQIKPINLVEPRS